MSWAFGRSYFYRWWVGMSYLYRWWLGHLSFRICIVHEYLCRPMTNKRVRAMKCFGSSWVGHLACRICIVDELSIYHYLLLLIHYEWTQTTGNIGSSILVCNSTSRCRSNLYCNITCFLQRSSCTLAQAALVCLNLLKRLETHATTNWNWVSLAKSGVVLQTATCIVYF